MFRMMRGMSYRNTILFGFAVGLMLMSTFTDGGWSEMLVKAGGGLAIFLFALIVMEESLDTVAGDRTKYWIGKFTSDRFYGLPALFTGILVTVLVQSSSVVTSILITLVAAGVLSFGRSIPVILGANIGTTITAQMIAWVGKMDLGLVGLILTLFFFVSFAYKDQKKTATYHIGLLLFGLGLLFLGLDFMSDAMRPLRDYQPFLDAMSQMTNPLYGIVTGALFTSVVQSSSATSGIVVNMANDGLIVLASGIALVMGANIGTSITAWLASRGKEAESKRVAYVHIVFNILGAAVFGWFIPVIVDLVTLSAHTIGQQVANAHTLFNVTAALLCLPLVKPAAAYFTKLIPAQVETEEVIIKPKYLLTERDMAQPMMTEIAVTGVRKEISRMTKKVRDMFAAVLPAMLNGNDSDLDQVADLDKGINILNHAIAANIHAIGRSAMPLSSDRQMDTLRDLWTAPELLETAADEVKSQLVHCGRDRIEQEIQISQGTQRNITAFHNLVLQQFDILLEVVRDSDTELSPAEEKKLEKKLRTVIKKRKDIRKLRKTIINDLQRKRLQTETDVGESPKLRLHAYSVEMDMIEHIEAVYRKIRELAKNRTFYFIEKPGDDISDETREE